MKKQGFEKEGCTSWDNVAVPEADNVSRDEVARVGDTPVAQTLDARHDLKLGLELGQGVGSTALLDETESDVGEDEDADDHAVDPGPIRVRQGRRRMCLDSILGSRDRVNDRLRTRYGGREHVEGEGGAAGDVGVRHIDGG